MLSKVTARHLRILLWLGLILIVGVVLWVSRTVLLPFFLGLVLAYNFFNGALAADPTTEFSFTIPWGTLGILVAIEFWNLQGDFAIQFGIVGQKHAAHGAFAKPLENSIAAEVFRQRGKVPGAVSARLGGRVIPAGVDTGRRRRRRQSG